MGAQPLTEPVEQEATLKYERVQDGPIPQECVPHWGPPWSGQSPDKSPNMVDTQMQMAHPWHVGCDQRLDVVEIAGSLLCDALGIVDMTEYTAGRYRIR